MSHVSHVVKTIIKRPFGNDFIPPIYGDLGDGLLLGSIYIYICIYTYVYIYIYVYVHMYIYIYNVARIDG